MPERIFSGGSGSAPGRRRRTRWRLDRALARAVGGVVVVSTLGAGARAATDYWDGDGVGTVGGGPGQWDLSLARWGASPAATTFGPFTNNDTAVFGGAGGTVNTTASVTANLDFESNGYLLQGGFTWPSAGASVNVAGGVSAELFGAAVHVTRGGVGFANV